ncbi:hypothetical protein [Hymenobacter bucti]|uniref:Uncharacterized protein n=1 Tax=Hymenobacter bucti TaxID=1844114 RepID=A0ABW4R1D3_9BACT
MHLLVYLRRQYSSPLPPTALLRRLEHTVPPRPAGFFWWLGIRYLPCWGEVVPSNQSFRARMRWGRSSGVVVRGRWLAAPTSVPLAGTVVQLTVRATVSELLASFCFLAIAAGGIRLSRPADVLIPLLLPGVMALFWTGLFWLDIRRAERYFGQALLLTKT